MLMTLAGAMSTAELGLSLAEMIRQQKVHAIVCTGANLEEDLFNLVAHNYYERIPQYRDLTAADESALLQRQMNRVTDTCIPEQEAMRRIEAAVLREWQQADGKGERLFPHEFLWRVLEQPAIREQFQIDPDDSWLIAAKDAGIPVFCPGWEDSTLGNMYAAHCLRDEITRIHTVRTGIEAMIELAGWYTQVSSNQAIGFFSDRRRYRRRFSNLRGADAASGSQGGKCTTVVLLLPDQRSHNKLWQLLRSGTQ